MLDTRPPEGQAAPCHEARALDSRGRAAQSADQPSRQSDFPGGRAMSWNGEIVIDLDSHVVERADRFYQDYIDPAYRPPYQQLCDAVARQAQVENTYSLFGSRNSVIEPIETGRPLGVRD